jgi:ATP-dependent Lon protease
VATRADGGQVAVPITIEAGDVRQYLGRSRFTSEVAERTDTPGIATGLPVTGIGGDVLFIEAAHMDGDEGLTLTGQLGDVMQESARIALSYVRSHAAELSNDPAAFKNQHFHVHVLAGAVPKDGPVGGCHHGDCARQSAHRSACPRWTGYDWQVTLQGKVLPIGGVKQKLLAAHRAGLTDVIIPVATSRTWPGTPRRDAQRQWLP